MKASNRAEADVLQREIDEEAKKTKSMGRAPLLAGTCVCSSAVSFPRLAMAIVRMEPCLVDLQWRLLADNTELTSWASNCKHARRFENQEYRACKPAQPTCTPAPRSARHSIDHVRCNLTHGNTRGATSLARGCLRSTIRSSLPDGGLFTPRTKLPMSICDLLMSISLAICSLAIMNGNRVAGSACLPLSAQSIS